MKTFTLVIFSLLASSFVFSGAYSDDDWNKKLIADGWKFVNLMKVDLTNTTWYGTKGITTNHSTRIRYIHPNGENVSFQFIKGSTVHILKLENQNDGSYCVMSKRFYGNKKQCRTIWTKKNVYISFDKNGKELMAWTIKKGNIEKFPY